MKVAIVSSKDLFDKTKNPTLCLSALRGTGECHQCDQITKKIVHTPLADLLKELKCKPNISDENMILLAKYDTLLQRRVQLQEDIDYLRKQIGIKQE
jgi:hypothetical protein